MTIPDVRRGLRARIAIASSRIESVCELTRLAGMIETMADAEQMARSPGHVGSDESEDDARAWLDAHSPTPLEEDL
jgi:hypothetical protein